MTHCKVAVNYIFIIQVGACLVDKNNMIVGLGYNGFPLDINDKDPKVNWNKEEKQKVGEHNNFYLTQLPYYSQLLLNSQCSRPC